MYDIQHFSNDLIITLYSVLSVSSVNNFFSVIEMKSKANRRLDSVNVDTDDSESEPEVINIEELKASGTIDNTDNTELRRRKVSKSEHSQSDAQIFTRSTSVIKDMAVSDYDDDTDDVKADDDDEEELKTGSVII